MDNGILGNYRVLDLADEKGDFCAKLLGDMGAEIIRIDKPGSSGGLSFTDLGKRRISLDIEKKKGAELFKQLVKTCDILIESCQPGFLTELGLDYPALEAINPGLIMVSITPYGQTGPYKDYNSSDLVASAMGGQMYVCGDRDKPPLKPFGPQAYYTASLFAANGVMLALWASHASNRGQYIDISIYESTAAALDHVLVRYVYEGTVAKRTGSLYWNNAFRVFSCRDGYVLLTLFHQWETMVEWLDSEGMAGDLKDSRWLNESERHLHVQHVIEVLEKWAAAHTVDELVEQGQLMRFPWARVASIPDVLQNPQLAKRGFIFEANDPVSGKKFSVPAAPYIMSAMGRMGSTQIFPAREYNRQIYHHELGLPEEEIEELARDGVI